MDDDNRRQALQLELLLQEGDRGLIQVDDRGRACEQDGYEEEDADEPAHAAHAVEHAGERDEHQAGACGRQLAAGGSHRGDDNEHRNQRCQRIEKRYIARRGRDLNVLAQVRAVDNRAVTGNRQGEERLTERIDPELPVQQAVGIEREDELVAFACAREGRNVNRHNEEQGKQQRDHDLAGLLNAACNAHRHDDDGNHDRHDDPEAVADAEDTVADHHADAFAEGPGLRSRCAERRADLIHILPQREQLAAEAHLGVLEDPAHNDRVADRKAHRTDDRQRADDLTGGLLAGALLHRLAERAYRARAAPAAEGELLHNARSTDQQYEQEVRQQEGHAAIGRDHVREAPDVRHTDCGADTGNDKAPFALKPVAGLGVRQLSAFVFITHLLHLISILHVSCAVQVTPGCFLSVRSPFCAAGHQSNRVTAPQSLRSRRAHPLAAALPQRQNGPDSCPR